MSKIKRIEMLFVIFLLSIMVFSCEYLVPSGKPENMFFRKFIYESNENRRKSWFIWNKEKNKHIQIKKEIDSNILTVNGTNIQDILISIVESTNKLKQGI